VSLTTVRVGELAEQVRGVSYGKEDASGSRLPGYVPVLRAGNITDDGLVFDDLVFVPTSRVSEKQRIRQHDVVIAASSGSLDVVGKAARAHENYEGGFGAFCKVLRPNSKVHPSYFAHFFKTQDYRRRVSALAAGANINNLRNEHLDDMQIPLPPLPEQRRIADVLDRAEALRAKRRAALAQLDTLTQAIFLEMFGDPVANPKKWSGSTLGNQLAFRFSRF
jgi:type I restriction enzyme, S subunit